MLVSFFEMVTNLLHWDAPRDIKFFYCLEDHCLLDIFWKSVKGFVVLSGHFADEKVYADGRGEFLGKERSYDVNCVGQEIPGVVFLFTLDTCWDGFRKTG